MLSATLFFKDIGEITEAAIDIAMAAIDGIIMRVLRIS